jgi:hypothetical protein
LGGSGINLVATITDVMASPAMLADIPVPPIPECSDGNTPDSAGKTC